MTKMNKIGKKSMAINLAKLFDISFMSENRAGLYSLVIIMVSATLGKTCRNVEFVN